MKSQNGESDVWGEPDPMEKDYSVEEILEMPIVGDPKVSEVKTQSDIPQNIGESESDMIDIGAIFEEEHIAPTKMAVGSSYIPDFDDDEIWNLY